MGRVMERRMGMGRYTQRGRRRSSRVTRRCGGDRSVGGASAALAAPSVSSTGPVLGDAEPTTRPEPTLRAVTEPDAHRTLALVESAAVRVKRAEVVRSAMVAPVREETAGRAAR